MKKVLTGLLLSLILIISLVGASTSSDFSLTNVPNKFLSGSTQRELIFDIVVPDNSNQADTLVSDYSSPSGAGDSLISFTTELYDDTDVSSSYTTNEPIYDDSTGDDAGVLDLDIDVLIRDSTSSESDGFSLSSFTTELYIDADSSSNYTLDEIIGFDTDLDGFFNSSIDTVIAGTQGANGSAWVSFTANEVYTDSNSNSFYDASEDIFDDLGDDLLALDLNVDTLLSGTTTSSDGKVLSSFVASNKFKDNDLNSLYTNGEDIYDDLNSNGIIDVVADVMASFTTSNSGTAVLTSDISLLELWSEDGTTPGFQSSEDTLITSTTTGIFPSLSMVIPSGGQRIYLTSNINPTATSGTTIQSSLGVNDFVTDTLDASNDGPSDSAISNSGIQTIDTVSPVTTDDYVYDWVPNDINVILSASDDYSGVAQTDYCVDTTNSCSPSTSGTTVAVTSEGVNYVRYNSADNVGNVETVNSNQVKIDKTNPTTISDSPTGWQSTNVTVTITSNDTLSGVNDTFVCVDQTDTCTPASGTVVVVSSEGNNFVRHYAIDNVGNSNTIISDSVDIDKTNPITTDDYIYDWVQGDITINLSAVDSHSGIAQTTYCVDTNNTCTPSTIGISTTITNEGDNYIRYGSTDNAGNNEAINSRLVKVDKTNPLTVSDAPSGWQNNNVTVTITPSDVHSGVNDTFVCTDQTDSCTPTSGTSIVVASEGTNYVRHYAIDNVGHTNAIVSDVVLIGYDAPTTTDDVPADWQTNPFNVTLNATDLSPGVNYTTYCVDSVGNCVPNITGNLINITENGVWYIRYFSTDLANNVEEIKNASNLAKLDKDAPSASNININRDYIYVSGPITVSCSVNAGVSGVISSKTWIKKPNGDLIEKPGTNNEFSLSDTNLAGEYTTGCKGTNGAGVTVNNQGPSFTAHYQGGGSGGGTSGGGSGPGARKGLKWNTLVDLGAVFRLEGYINDVFNLTAVDENDVIVHQHEVTIKGVNKGIITLLIESEPMTLTLKEGHTELVDLDNDGTTDVRFTAIEVGTNTKMSKIEVKFIKPQPTTTDTDVESEDETEEEITEEEEEEDEEKSRTKGIIIAIIVILVVIVLAVLLLRKKPEEKEEKK